MIHVPAHQSDDVFSLLERTHAQGAFPIIPDVQGVSLRADLNLRLGKVLCQPAHRRLQSLDGSFWQSKVRSALQRQRSRDWETGFCNRRKLRVQINEWRLLTSIVVCQVG